MEFLTQINYLALILWMAVLYLLGKFIKKWWISYVTKYNERVIAQREEAIRVEKETERLNIKTTFTFINEVYESNQTSFRDVIDDTIEKITIIKYSNFADDIIHYLKSQEPKTTEINIVDESIEIHKSFEELEIYYGYKDGSDKAKKALEDREIVFINLDYLSNSFNRKDIRWFILSAINKNQKIVGLIHGFSEYLENENEKATLDEIKDFLDCIINIKMTNKTTVPFHVDDAYLIISSYIKARVLKELSSLYDNKKVAIVDIYYNHDLFPMIDFLNYPKSNVKLYCVGRRTEELEKIENPNMIKLPLGDATEFEYTSVEDIEKKHMVLDERLGDKPVAFGFQNSDWLKFKSKMQDGDKIVHYRSAPDTWRNHAGSESIRLVRDGKTVASVFSKMN